MHKPILVSKITKFWDFLHFYSANSHSIYCAGGIRETRFPSIPESIKFHIKVKTINCYLTWVINRLLNENKKLYVTFLIDFPKAFDCIIRDIL